MSNERRKPVLPLLLVGAVDRKPEHTVARHAYLYYIDAEGNTFRGTFASFDFDLEPVDHPSHDEFALVRDRYE